MRRHPHVIRDTRSVRLLASPLRQAILDWIGSNGPATVAQLSRRFRRAPNRLYYHVRLLQRAGLLIADDDTGETGRREARFDVAGRPLSLQYAPGAGYRGAVTHVIDALLRNAARDFAREIRDPTLSVEGPRRELWAGRIEALLDESDLATLNELLRGILKHLGQARDPSARRREFQFSWVLSPSGTASAPRARRKTKRR